MLGWLDTFVHLLFTVLTWAIIIRALLSWFNLPQGHPIVTLLIDITEPILAPLRRVVPKIGMIDITPIVAIILMAWVIEPILRMVIRSAGGA
jgi:YggT family protein